ncbi:conserved Plasmodium protein, unknown function [Plasmodium malariae]|uniref:YGGT family protein n=1 Tax=Plasmodium malariae TaxID=5858 RepID=A0A1D3PB79_PLAMA|nr:conserved Plasmodium protein, unknown function [Plasmodium malariae]SCN12304.1 conserved Plasmodium protein, unknown function [Plasmodium malariae]
MLFLFSFLSIFVNVENKNMKISKFKAFIIQSQNDKYGIFNIRNNSFKKIKEIQKNFKSNIFVQEQIKYALFYSILQNISRKINTFKLHLFYSLPLPSVLKYLKLSGNSLRLSVLHFIRIYKFIIYIRCLLEWLPQINPHLNPFVYIFTYTNSYVQFFHKNIPSVMGIDLSGVLSWLFLEMIESYLS